MTVNNDTRILKFYTPRTTEKWVGIAILTAVGVVALTSLALSWQKVSPFTEIKGVWNISFWGGAGLGALIAAGFLIVRIRPSTTIYRKDGLEYVYTKDMNHRIPPNGYVEHAGQVSKYAPKKTPKTKPATECGLRGKEKPDWEALERAFAEAVVYQKDRLKYVYTTDLHDQRPRDGYFEYDGEVTKYAHGKPVGEPQSYLSNGKEPNWAALKELFNET